MAMLEAHRSAMVFAQNNEFQQGRQALQDWVTEHPDHPLAEDVRQSAERLRQAANLLHVLEQNSEPLIGIELSSVPGGGSVAAFRRGKLRVRRILGPGGIADIEVELHTLSEEDFLTLLRIADPESALTHGATLLLAQGRLSSALSLIERAETQNQDTKYLRDWYSDWDQIRRNLAAERAIREAEQLIKANQFADAQSALRSLMESYQDTRLVSDLRAEDLHAWREIATRELSW